MTTRVPGLASFRRWQNRMRDVLACPTCGKSLHVFNAGETMKWKPEAVTPETHCTCPGGICDTMGARSRHARWDMLHSDEHSVTIRDEGPWTFHPTVTTDAEWVVASMVSIVGQRRLFCVDHDKRLIELRMTTRMGLRRFAGFAPGPINPQEIMRLTGC